MTAQQYQNVRHIFHLVAEIPPSRRAEVILRECAGDLAIRAEVESLLSYHDRQKSQGPISPLLIGFSEYENAKRGFLDRIGHKLFDRRSLRWIVFFVFWCLVLALGQHWRTRVRARLELDIQDHLTSVLSSNVQAVNLWADGVFQDLQHLREDPTLKKIVIRREQKARTSFTKMMAANIYDHYLVIDRNFRVIASDTERWVGLGPLPAHDLAEPFARVLHGESIWLPRRMNLRQNVDDPPRYNSWFAEPIRTRDGSVIGGLAVALDASKYFEKFLTVGRWGNSAETYAFDSNGRLLSHSRFADVLRKSGVLKTEHDFFLRDPGVNIMEGFRPLGSLEEQPLTQLVQKALAGRSRRQASDGIAMASYPDYRGVPSIGAWQWLPGWDFAMVTEVNRDDAFAALDLIDRVLTTALIILSFLSVMTLRNGIGVWRLKPAALIGAKIGQYKIVRKIGQGGMGQVFLARHQLLKRPTAIKVIRPDVANEETMGRFEQEVLATSRLSHPNTVVIYDFGRTAQGAFYCAMEYLSGISLAKLMQISGAIQPARAVYVLQQIASSLREAHLYGLIHRDIKPQNVMLCTVGGDFDVVKVLDFGLVKDIANLSFEANVVRGTPAYMAPEVLSGGEQESPVTDVYSLGVVAYKMLSGRNLYDGANDAALLFDILRSTPQPLATGSKELDDLVMQCVSKDPAQRPQSMDELLDSLKRLNYIWSQADAKAWWDDHREL